MWVQKNWIVISLIDIFSPQPNPKMENYFEKAVSSIC